MSDSIGLKIELHWTGLGVCSNCLREMVNLCKGIQFLITDQGDTVLEEHGFEGICFLCFGAHMDKLPRPDIKGKGGK